MSLPITWRDGLPWFDVHELRLPCGLEVVVHEDRTVPLCAVWIGYRVGSSDEDDGTSGFAHLFEHMFKNSLHLAGRHHYEVLRAVGATNANAQTGTDRTVYHETVPSAALETALWIEADRLGYFLPGLDQARLDRQKSVVAAERRQRYENAPYGPERFAVAEALYPEGHPLRHLTIGRHQDIAAASLERVERFYRTWYVPANATLVLSGDIGAAEAEALCQRWFGSFPASARPQRPQRPQPVVDGPVAIVIDDRLAALDRVHRAWHGPPHYTDDDRALDVVALNLTAHGTGRLWRRLVHEQRLAQRVGAHVRAGRLGGELHVSADLRPGVEPARVSAALDEELDAIRDGALDQRLVERAVTRREAGLMWRLDGVARRASLLCTSMLSYGSVQGVADELAGYARLDAATVAAAARRWLAPERSVEVVTRAGRARV